MRNSVKQEEEEGTENSLSPWKSLVFLSISYLFVFTAFEAIQNLQSSLNNDSNVGVTSLAVLYCVAITGAFFTPLNTKLLGPKRLLQLGFFLHLCYIASNFYPVKAMMIPASAIVGLGFSGQATSMGIYLAEMSKVYLIKHNLKSGQFHGILSMFNGIFYSSFKGTHISGNLISSLILFSSPVDSEILEGNVCGALVCSGSNNDTVIEKPDQKVVYILFGAFMACSMLGSTVLALCLPPISVEKHTSEDTSVARHLSGCIRTASGLRFLLLMPLFTAQSMLVMMMYAGFTKAFVTCTIGVQWVGYVMVSLGVAAVCSSLLVNNLTRFLGRITVFVIGIMADFATILVMYNWIPDTHTEKYKLFILPTLAGFSEGILQPQFSALVADIFHESMPSAYPAFHACKCTGFSMCLVVSTFGCLYHQLYLVLSLYSIGAVGYMVTEIRENRHTLEKCCSGRCFAVFNRLFHKEEKEDVKACVIYGSFTSAGVLDDNDSNENRTKNYDGDDDDDDDDEFLSRPKEHVAEQLPKK